MRYVFAVVLLLWAITIVALATGLAGCQSKPEIRYIKVPVPTPSAGSCLDAVGELELHPFSFDRGTTQDKPTACPAVYAVCVGPLDFSALSMNYSALIRFARDTITSCSPKPITTPAPATPAPGAKP